MGGKYSVERCVQTNTQNERTQTNVHCDRAIARKGDIEWKSQHKVCSWQEEKGPNISTNIPAKKSGWKRDPNWASKLAHEWTERTVGKRAFSYSLCTFNLGKCSLPVSSLWSTCDYLHRWKRKKTTHRNTKRTKSIPTDLSRFRECKSVNASLFSNVNIEIILYLFPFRFWFFLFGLGSKSRKQLLRNWNFSFFLLLLRFRSHFLLYWIGWECVL